MGDFNAKNIIFNSKRNNKNGSILEHILLNNNCQILNDSFDPTFNILKHNSPDYGECLDLFLGSPLLANIVEDYQVIRSGLDSCQAIMFHSVIQICIPNKDSQSTNIAGIGNSKAKYLFDKANWIKFQDYLENIDHTKFSHLSIVDKLKLISLKINEATDQSIPKVTGDVQSKLALPKNILLTSRNVSDYNQNTKKTKPLKTEKCCMTK